MNSRHKLIHLISLLAIVVNLLMPLGAPLVTAQDLVDISSDSVVTTSQDQGDAGSTLQVPDTDGDGLLDDADNCTEVANADQSDIDGDSIGDACDPLNDLDVDADGINNELDNCPDLANADQADVDLDGIGDACDPLIDNDGDGVANPVDNCPAVANGDQSDIDGDGVGDPCDPLNELDVDADGINNDLDNCPAVANADQTDFDGDGVGDACDDVVVLDRDGDGVNDAADVCPDVKAVNDANGDGCEDVVAPVDSDGDGLTDDVDACPTVKPVKDADRDGCEDKEAPKPTATTAPSPTPTQAPKTLAKTSANIQPMAQLTSLTQPDLQAQRPGSGEWVQSLGGNEVTCGSWVNFRVVGTSAPGNNSYTFSVDFDKLSGGNKLASYTAAELVDVVGGVNETAVVTDTGSAYRVTVTFETTGAGPVEVYYRAFLTCNGIPNGNLQASRVGSGSDTTPIQFGGQAVTYATLPTITVTQAQCVNGQVTNPSITWSGQAGFANIFTSPSTYTDGDTVYVRVLLAPGYTLPSPLPTSWTANPAPSTDSSWSAQYRVVLTDVNCATSTLPTLTSQNGVCTTLPTYTITAGTGYTIDSVTVNGTAASTAPGTYQIITPQQTNTVTMEITLIPGYKLADMTGWTLVSGNTYTKTVNPTYRVCTQAVIPSITVNPYVCTAGVTTGTNKFTVEVAAGLTIQTVSVDGNQVGTLADTYNLPTANGTYTITVRASLNPDAAAPGGISPDPDGLYTFTRTVTVAACTPSTVPSILEIDPFVCVDGATEGANTFVVDPGVGFTITSVLVDGTAAVETSTDGTYELPATNGTYTITVTAMLNAGSAAPEAPEPVNGVYTFTASATVAACTPSTVPSIVDIVPFVCVDGATQGANTFTVNPGVGFTITSVSVGGETAVETTTAGTYELPDTNGTYTITVTATLNAGSDAPDTPLPEDGVYTFTASATVAECTPSTVPSIINIIPYVCVEGETAGANTFTVDPGVGFTITSVLVDGETATETSTAGTYNLPAADGTYTIAVTATLNAGSAAPDDHEAINGVYTFTATTTVARCVPAVAIAKSVQQGGVTLADGASVEPGSPITWVISLWSTGNGNATVSVTDTLPTGFTPGELPAGCMPSATNTITCVGVSVPYNTTQANPVTISIPGTVAAAGATCGPITNSASFTLNNVPSAPATSSVNINCQPAPDMLKVSNVETTTPGGEVTWTITAWNTGTLDTTVTITDTLPAGFDLTSALPAGCAESGQVITCTGVVLTKQTSQSAPAFTLTLTGTVANDGLTCGEITNEASFPNGGTTIVRTDSVDVQCRPGFSLDKDVNRSSVRREGTVLIYTVYVWNSGNTDLAPFTFEDTFSQGLSNLSGPTNMSGPATFTRDGTTGMFTVTGLDEGETISFEMRYTITQADLDSGETIKNCVIGGQRVTASNCPTTTIQQEPGIDVGKTATGQGLGLNTGVVAPNDVANAGDTITFNITVENTGNITQSDIEVTDNVALGTGTVTFGTATGGTITTAGNVITVTSDIAPGGVVTIPVTYTLTQADINGGSVENCAVYTPQVGTDPDCATVTIPQSATFTFTKVGPDAPIVPGQAIQFTVTFTNTGNVTVASATIADPLPALPSGTWDVALVGDSESVASFPYQVTNLAPGASVTLVATAMVPAEIETPNTTWCKEWDNTATVTGSFANQAPISGTESASAQVNCTSVQIAKSGPETATPGGAVNYSLLVENLGNTTVFGVTVTDTLDDRLIPVSAAGEGWNCSIAGQEVTCTLESLVPGATATIAIATTVIEQPAAAQCDSDIINTATISSFTLTQMVTSRLMGQITPPGTQISSNQVSTDLDCQPKIEWQKTVVDSTVSPGEDIVFKVKVTNTGTYYKNDISLTDNLPAGLDGLTWVLTLNPADAGVVCEQTGTNIVCDNIDLEAYGDSFEVTLTATTDAENPVCGEYTNTASETNGTRATVRTATVTIDCVPDYTMEKNSELTNDADENGEVSLGDTITYTIHIENDGNQVLSGLTLNDVFSGSDSLVWTAPVDFDGENIPDIAIGDELDLVATYVVTQDDVNAGQVENCATVTLPETDLSVNDCATDDIPQYPSIDIEKTDSVMMNVVGPEDRVDAGDQIEYTITVENTGNVTLTNVAVNDPLVGFSDTIDSLAPGAIESFTVTYDVTQADLNAGTVQNCADVTGDSPNLPMPLFAGMQQGDETPFAYDEACIDTPLEKAPGIDITKTATVLDTVAPSDRVDAGDTIEYTFTVVNTGNVTLENVLIDDPIVGITWVDDPNIGTLLPGAEVVLKATYLVTQADLDAGEVENCADVTGQPPVIEIIADRVVVAITGDEPMPTTLFDEGCVTTEIPKDAHVVLEKTGTGTLGDDDGLNLGDVITYTFTVTNTGNVTLEEVTINDPMEGITWTDGNVVSNLAPGEARELTATYTVTQADVDMGTVVNCADISGTAPDDSPVTDDDCDTQVIGQNPAILVALVCPGPEGNFLPGVGDEVNFELTITNTGDLTVNDIEITTSREGELDSPFPTALAPGQSETRTFTMVVTQADYDARGITVEVSAEGMLPDGSSAKLASMVLMQSVGDSVENTLSLQCPMKELQKPTPKPIVKPAPKPAPKPVTNLPNTGTGSVATSGAIIWAAAFTTILFGASAFGIRRKHQ